MRQLTLLFLCLPFFCLGQQVSLLKETTALSGHSNNVDFANKQYHLRQVVGQQGAVDSFIGKKLSVSQGFLYPMPIRKKQELPQEHIKVYPNPTVHTLNIILPKEAQEAELRIYHITGKLALAESFDHIYQITIPTEKLSKGNYLVKVKTNYRTFLHKILKQ